MIMQLIIWLAYSVFFIVYWGKRVGWASLSFDRTKNMNESWTKEIHKREVWLGGEVACVEWFLKIKIATNLQTNLSDLVKWYFSVKIMYPYNVEKQRELL